MVYGLRRKTPWAGLDLETLDSCYGHGAAVISRVAASGQRPEWRSRHDLEKAQVAAFRHQALDHWKRVNAQSRRGDRLAVVFDPERHAAPDAPMDRLFEQPDLHAIQRDLLAELGDAELRVFWAAVFGEEAGFKAAGDRLGLDKAQVMARTRAGRTAFASYLDRRETGELCRGRAEDIAALRAGSADEPGAERAEAHLECCYACSLIHRPHVGAFERGILGAAPTGLLLQLLRRASDVASVPAARWTEMGGAARVAAGGLAALTAAGTGIGVEAAVDRHPSRRASVASGHRAQAVARERFHAPAQLLASRAALAITPATSGSVRPAGAAAKTVRKGVGRRPRSITVAAFAATRSATSSLSPRGARSTSVASTGPAVQEFSFERGTRAASRSPTPAAVPAPAGAVSTPLSPAAAEFSKASSP